MRGTSSAATWPFRKWFLAGAAMAGSATTLAGSVAVEGTIGCGSSCATCCNDTCTYPCEFGPMDAAIEAEASVARDGAPRDAKTNRADATLHPDASVDGRGPEASDAPLDAAVERDGSLHARDAAAGPDGSLGETDGGGVDGAHDGRGDARDGSSPDARRDSTAARLDGA